LAGQVNDIGQHSGLRRSTAFEAVSFRKAAVGTTFRSTQIGKGFFGACGISLDRGLMDLIPPRFGQA